MENIQGNAILDHLGDAERASLEKHGKTLSLKMGQAIFSDDAPSDVVYFPVTAMISLIAEMKDGAAVEYGSIGREGMLGLHVALGAQPLRGRAICQLAGKVLCMDGAALRNVIASRSPGTKLYALLLRYAQATINVLAQSAACNALHSISQRGARWLLITRDRAQGPEFEITQEFWSMMLGTRRASITQTASDLRMKGVIEYYRGHLKILDDDALRQASCECYLLIRREYERVFEASLGLD